MGVKTPSDIYISKVKALFPFVGTEEKKFLRTLRITLEDYCSTEKINTLEELENGFGKAEDAVHEYISSVETDNLVKRLNTRKLVKRVGLVILIIIAVAAIFFSVFTYKKYQLLKETTVFFENVTVD